MHDEFRVRVQVQTPDELLAALKSVELDDERHRGVGRVAVTHAEDHVFIYADSRASAEHARAVVEQALADAGIAGQIEVAHWHPVEERWEDADAPLPASPEERRRERERLDETETEESRAQAHPQWEVRITLPSHHDARAFAARLEDEGIPVEQRWRHVLVGASNEDEAQKLAERLRGEAPEGSEVVPEGSGLPYWEMLHPFAIFGGLAN